MKTINIAAVKKVKYGHISSTLWLKGSGLGIIPYIFSYVTGPKILIAGYNNTEEA